MNMNIKENLIVILSLILAACNQKPVVNEMYVSNDTIYLDSTYFAEMPIEEKKQRFIDTGNPVYFYFIPWMSGEQLFIYNIINANKYGDHHSEYMYYEMFKLYFHNMDSYLNFDLLDTISRKQVTEKLLDAAEAGVPFANLDLYEYYKKGIGMDKDEQMADIVLKRVDTKRKKVFKPENVYEYLGKQLVIRNTLPNKKKPINEQKLAYFCCPEFGDKKLFKNICEQGDTNSYKIAKAFFRKEGVEREVIFFSIVMANKYNNARACYDVYYCLWMAFNGGKDAEQWDMTRFDPKSREFALFYLKRGASLRNKACEEILLKQF